MTPGFFSAPTEPRSSLTNRRQPDNGQTFRYNRVLCDVCDNHTPPSGLTVASRADNKIHGLASAPHPLPNNYWRRHDPSDIQATPTLPRGVRVHHGNWFLKQQEKISVENENNRKSDICERNQKEKRDTNKKNLNTLSYTEELRQAQIKLTEQQKKCAFNKAHFPAPLPPLPTKPPTGSNDTGALAHYYNKRKNKEALPRRATTLPEVQPSHTHNTVKSVFSFVEVRRNHLWTPQNYERRSAKASIHFKTPQKLTPHPRSQRTPMLDRSKVSESNTRFTQTGGRLSNQSGIKEGENVLRNPARRPAFNYHVESDHDNVQQTSPRGDRNVSFVVPNEDRKESFFAPKKNSIFAPKKNSIFRPMGLRAAISVGTKVGWSW